MKNSGESSSPSILNAIVSSYRQSRKCMQVPEKSSHLPLHAIAPSHFCRLGWKCPPIIKFTNHWPLPTISNTNLCFCWFNRKYALVFVFTSLWPFIIIQTRLFIMIVSAACVCKPLDPQTVYCYLQLRTHIFVSIVLVAKPHKPVKSKTFYGCSSFQMQLFLFVDSIVTSRRLWTSQGMACYPQL